MGIGYRPAIFLSVREVKNPVDTKSISYADLGANREYFPSIMDGVKRSLLGFDYLEVGADVLGKKEIIELEEMQYLEKFKKLGKREFLREMNEMAFLDLCDKINIMKEKIDTLSVIESKNLQENIDLQIKTIQNYEKFKHNFVDWFTSNHFDVPIIHGQKLIKKIETDKLLSADREDARVPISNFKRLVIEIPEYMGPREKVIIWLDGKLNKTKPVKIDQKGASILMFLAKERERSAKGKWLLHPEDHINVLREINNKLELPDVFESEILEKPAIPMTWIYDFRNTFRIKIVSKINVDLRRQGGVAGYLIDSIRDADLSKIGTYTLSKSITEFHIGSPTN